MNWLTLFAKSPSILQRNPPILYGWKIQENIRPHSTLASLGGRSIVLEDFNSYPYTTTVNIHVIISQRGGLSWQLSSRDPQSAGRPFSTTIQSRSKVSGEAFLGHYPVEILSQWGGLSWPLSSWDLQSAGRPFLATIQPWSSVSGEAFLGDYPVEIFLQQGGLSWPLSSRDLQSVGRPFFV